MGTTCSSLFRILALASWMLAFAAFTARCATGAEEPGAASQYVLDVFQDLRRLSASQEQAAKGRAADFEEQRDLALAIGGNMISIPTSALLETKYVDMVIKFVLSGGDSQVLARIRDQGQFPAELRSVIEGALAYARGENSSAEQWLAGVDHRALSPILSGHVALVRAVIALGSDRLQALHLAEDARLLSPGTLIEETAHRLIIEISIAHDDRARLAKTTLRYATRFPDSQYAIDLDRKMARYIAARYFGKSEEGQAWLAQLKDRMPDQRRRIFILGIADLALRNGKIATAEYMARLAKSEFWNDTALKAMATAVLASTMIFDQRRREARNLLDEAQRGAPPDVLELIAVVRMCADRIDADPPASNQSTYRAMEADPVEPVQRRHQILQARTRLQEADALLVGGKS